MKPPALPPTRRTTSLLLVLAASVAAGAALLTPRGVRPTDDAPPPPPPDRGPLSARATSSHVLQGTSETHIAITIRAPEQGATERPPVSLAVVIDRSGSMSGQPLEDAKAAAQRLVELLEPRDRVAVITYSNRGEIIAPMAYATPEVRAHAARAIAAITSDGGTNISDGLLRGAEAIAGRGGLRRIVLISDGQATAGIVDRGGLADLAAATAAGGTPITSVGVGLDFDERTMSEIAVAGRGHYYFVEDTARMAELFEDELESLGDTVASEASLTVTPAPGVEILEAYGYRMHRQVGLVRIPVADLRSGEVRKVVLRVRVATSGAGTMDLAGVSLAWTPRNQPRIRVGEAAVQVAITDNPEAVRRHRDRVVVRQVEDIETARALEQAADAYERGDHDGAAGILDQRAAAASQISTELGDKEIEKKVRAATGKARGSFATPPADPSAAKRALKTGRADAYDLAY